MVYQLDRKPFDIREHLDNLTPSKKGKNYYECPVCEGHSLSIEPNSGKYQCFSGGCRTAEIREAVSPWAEVVAGGDSAKARSPRSKKKTAPKPKPAPVPIGLKMLQLAEPAGDCPEAQPISDELWGKVKGDISKKTPKTPRSSVNQIAYSYGDGKIVYRVEWPDAANPKGHEKTYRQSHIDINGKRSWKKGDQVWAAYRIDEIVEALEDVGINEAVAVLGLEGEPNVELARSNGIASLTFQGSAWKEDQIIALVEALRATGKNVTLVILRDNDTTGDKKAKLVKAVCDRLQFPCVIIDPVAISPEIPDKGDIKEILEAMDMDTEEFIRRLEEEIHRQAKEALAYDDNAIESLQKSFSQEADSNNFPAKSKNKKLLNIIGSRYGDRLRLNEMSQQVELDGEDCQLDGMYLEVASEMDIDIEKGKCADLFSRLAKKKTYSPVRDYLSSLSEAPPINLDALALRYFGSDDELHAKMFRKTLIAAVARTFEPGCKLDTLCILQGDQGFFKSLFWSILTGEKWFTDNLNEANEKDEKLKLRRYWILEFSEFESAYKRKEVSQLKAFLSTRIDSLRRPYGRAIEDFPRTSIFCGTTNKQEFLQDPTGERRYWVIPVKQKIPIHLLETERDQIWAEAVRCYRAGESWWMTPEEDAQLADLNRGWQSSDLWESAIIEYLENRVECTVTSVLYKAIGVELPVQSKREQMRVSDILRRLGWKKAEKQKRVDGRVQWFWEKIGGGDEVMTGVVTGVMTPSTSHSEPISSTLSPPVTTFLTNNSSNIANCELKTDSDPSVDIDNQFQESLQNLGGDTPLEIAQPLVEQVVEGVTTSLSLPLFNVTNPQIQDAVWQVAAASSWEEVGDIWGDDDELRAQIKAALPPTEYTRIGKLKKLWYSANSAPLEVAEVLASTIEPSEPELIAPPTVEAMPESIAPSLEPQPVPEPIAPPTVAAVKKARKEFKVGGRVIVADPDSKIYKGASGKIISTAGSGANQKYRVQFDKLVHNMASSIFKTSELMSAPIALPASEELPKKP